MLARSELKRVLILEPSGNLWGSERVLLDFLNAVAGARFDIAVCCPPDTPILKYLARLPVQVFPNFISNLHQKSQAKRFLAAAKFISIALRFRPQVIHVNQAGATRIALLAGRLLNIPVVAHVRMAEDVRHLVSRNVKSRVLPKVICVSKYIQSLFSANNGSPTGTVMFYDPYAPRVDWHKSFPRVGSGYPVFSCVGRLAPSKGQDILLRAIDALKREGILVGGLFLGAAGPGSDFETDLRRLAADLNVTEQVIWMGFKEEVISLITNSVAQVCTSELEALGRVVFEAWDAGIVPVAWAGSGGPAEVIGASGGGLLYPKQDGQSLAAVLKQVINISPGERERLIQNGRVWLRDNCDLKIYTRNIVHLWQDVLNERAGHAVKV